MATIIKRKKAYSVVYNYVDENGETKQKMGNRTYPQRSLEAKSRSRKHSKRGNIFTPKQADCSGISA